MKFQKTKFQILFLKTGLKIKNMEWLALSGLKNKMSKTAPLRLCERPFAKHFHAAFNVEPHKIPIIAHK
jgi:hypothetical protein